MKSEKPRDKIKALLHARGVHVTSPRIVVLEVLGDARHHLSADEIYALALERYPTVNMVTIYRTLETFEQHGLAVRGILGDKVTRWERADDAHHHLVCQHCGALVLLDDAPFQHLAQTLAQRYGVSVNPRHLALHGLCAACTHLIHTEPRPHTVDASTPATEATGSPIPTRGHGPDAAIIEDHSTP